MRHLPLIALLGWAAVIFTVSSIPNPPDAGGGDWKYNAAHVIEYAIFGALACIALHRYARRLPLAALIAAAWLLSVLYGISDEFHQSFVPNRDANPLDVALDATGAAIGIFATAWRLRRAPPIRNPKSEIRNR